MSGLRLFIKLVIRKIRALLGLLALFYIIHKTHPHGWANDPGLYAVEYYNRTPKFKGHFNENTECAIPVLDPFNHGMTRFFSQNWRTPCSQLISYFRSDYTSQGKPVIVRSPTFPLDEMVCCYQILEPMMEKPYYMTGSETCEQVINSTTVLQPFTEFVLVKCFNVYGLQIQNGSYAQHLERTGLHPYHQEILIFVPKPKAVQPQDKKLNVIIFGIDTVSRMNMIRSMRHTYKYLITGLKAVDLRGYSKVGDATLENLMALLMGLNYSQVREKCWTQDNDTFDSCPWIWKRFKRNDYVTLFAEDHQSVFWYRYGGFRRSPTDYYLTPFGKWLERETRRRSFGNMHCIRNTSAVTTIVDYARKAGRALEEVPSFQIYWAGVVSYYPTDPWVIDKAVVKLLQEWNSTGVLNRSLVFLLSDHGWKTRSILHHEQARLENRMPFAFLLLPEWFRKKYREAYGNLVENQWRLTTPFDVHATLKDVLNIEGNLNPRSLQRRTDMEKTGVSLFLPIPKHRDCHMAAIDETWCICGVYKSIPSGSADKIKMLADYAVMTINEMVSANPVCYQYELARVLSSEERVGPQPKYLQDLKTYRLHIQVKPKGATFEVVLFEDQQTKDISMSKAVFRTNSFVAHCKLSDNSIRNLCSCSKSRSNSLV